MAARKPKTNAFESAVRLASAKSSSEEIGVALGALVKARLRTRPVPTVAMQRETATTALASVAQAKRSRRSSRRRGRNQNYCATDKVDISRLGTFRHYMLATIRKHTSTWDAESAHAQCDNPKFAKNRLDFSWAASEGYIEFI